MRLLPLGLLVLVLVVVLTACGDDSPADAATDARPDSSDGSRDAPSDRAMNDAEPDAPGDAMPDAAIDGDRPDADPGECGDEMLPTSSIVGTEGLAIAADGTLYYSQTEAVGRRRPGMPPEDGFVELPGATTVWGVALRDDTLFVASPSMGGVIYSIDLGATVPEATPLLEDAGGANGLVVGPDGAVYYSDFSGNQVYRVSDGGDRTAVTTTEIDSPNGLFFESASALLVLSYSAGQVIRLTLDENAEETGRDPIFTDDSTALDGIAQDDRGRFYLGDNGEGRLLRWDPATGDTAEVLLPDVESAANIVFGRGALRCTDVYVASGGSLGRYAADVGGRP